MKTPCKSLAIAVTLLVWVNTLSAQVPQPGTLDQSFNPSLDPTTGPRIVGVLGDGKMIVEGRFHFVSGVPRPGLARLNQDGSLDASFKPAGLAGRATSLALQADGSILVAGNFGIKRLHGIAPPMFTSIDRQANGAIHLTLSGQPDQRFIFQVSDDLKTWLPLRTNTATGSTLEFEDADAANFPRRFYRARLVNP